MPAPTIPYTFNPGIANVIYLPVDRSEVAYYPSITLGLAGSKSLSACYDKYGALWKWSTFEKNTLSSVDGLSSTRVPFPSSWSTMQCTLCAGSNNPGLYGTFPKKWRPEGSLSAEYFNPSFLPCSANPVTWTLESYDETGKFNWIIGPQTTSPLSASTSFSFTLNLSNYGEKIYTVSEVNNTKLYLTFTMPTTCLDTEVIPPTATVSYITETYSITSVPPPAIRLYTPNRFVLSGSNVKFENLITLTDNIASLTADFDDNNIFIRSGNNLKNDFYVTYFTEGVKTVTVQAILNYSTTPLLQKFPEIVRVVKEYDTVSEAKYRSEQTAINLPYTIPPQVGANDWIIAENINSCLTKIYDNLSYLDSIGNVYSGTYSDYFGYLGVQPTIQGPLTALSPWTWEDVDCLNTSLPYSVTWADLLTATNPANTGRFAQPWGTWLYQTCGSAKNDPNCFGRYCTEWNWKARKIANAAFPITWKDTITNGPFAKRWYFETCVDPEKPVITVCDEGLWNVNIPNINRYYDPIANPAVQPRCIYTGVASKNNTLYLAQKTQVKLLTSDYNATFSDYRNTYDGTINFSGIRNVCLDSEGKIFVLDNILSQVAVYKPVQSTSLNTLPVFTNWGGAGGAAANNSFNNPNDICVDQLDNVWVCDTGNFVIKHYSNTGTWLNTIYDSVFKLYPPLSLAVDSSKRLHVLTTKEVRVYNYEGTFITSYQYLNFTDNQIGVKIISSYNREIIYLATNASVIKYFKNTVFAGYIVQNKQNVTNITGLYHDEFRNLLITVNDKILKYSDLMTIKQLKGTLPTAYWSLNDILIHKDEYIQNWVYTKAFERLWDNIELFRNSLQYSTGNCKSYISPLHGKEKMIIGQNEIVTSVVVNRVLKYLWENFYTLVKYFDPSCKN